MQNSGNEAAKNHYGLVSVIMPCYNASAYLSETIESVLKQTYTDWELILVDDCSTDRSLVIASSYRDPRIHILKNEKNMGAVGSRNRAIEAANGRWIAFLDSDDTWCSDKLEKHLAFMVRENSEFSCTDYTVVDVESKPVTVFAPKKDYFDYKTILKHCYIGCSTVIYDSEVLGKVYMPSDAIKREDFACWLSILKAGTPASCYHAALTNYRVHSSSVSSNKTKMIKYQWNVYRKVEKLSVFASLYYMAHWAIKGVLKYR